MKEKIFVVLFSLTGFFSHAQDQFVHIPRMYFLPNYNGLEVETRGSRYFNNETFVPGEIGTKDSIYSVGLLFRYEAVLRQVQIKLPDGKVRIVDPHNVMYFKLIIDNKPFFFEKNMLPDRRTSAFLQVIYSSPTMRLLRDVHKKTQRINTVDPYTSAPKESYDQVKNDYKYYLVYDNMQTLRTVEPDRRSFVGRIPQKADFITELFNRKEFRIDLTVSSLKELMRILDEELQKKAE